MLFSLVTIFSFLLALAFFNRKGVADDLINGVSDTIDDIDSANGLVGGVALLQLLLQLAAAIVVCLWAKRIADNAKARGVSNVSPGLACGGWFIPIANLFVPFNELRKSVKGTGGSGSGITGWQIAWIVAAIGGIAAFSSRGDIVLSDSDALDQLSQQTTIALVGAVLSLLSLVFAIRGIREANSTVSNNA